MVIKNSLIFAENLHIPGIELLKNEQYTLFFGDAKWQLMHHLSSTAKPFYIDFLSDENIYRKKKSNIRDEALAKAVGLKKGFRPRVIDATAGLGRDAFLLAGFGCDVLMLERSPHMALLLLDALYRYKVAAPKALLNIDCIYTNAIEFLKKLPGAAYPEVIVVDPMYPLVKQKALIKQPMRIVRGLVGDDLDAQQLFLQALQCAKKRVVVKRPKQAAYLGERPANFSITSQQHRFDVYLT